LGSQRPRFGCRYRKQNEQGAVNSHRISAWLQSALPYSPTTLNLRTNVLTQPIGQRPLIELEPTDHPLSVEQRHGITMARVREIAEAALDG
jgi:hypothetical protein